MLLLEAKNIKKAFGKRILFELKDFKIYSEDKIGVVGLNGAGKTTLVNILAGVDKNYSGYVKTYGSISYIEQLGDIDELQVNSENLSKFKLEDVCRQTMSGGEKTKLKISSSFSSQKHILFADEPTCNLDIDAIIQLEKKLKEFKSAILLISHDMKFLDNVCNKILEIEDGTVQMYNGNYSSYMIQKQDKLKIKESEYNQYIKERNRLTDAMRKRTQKSKSLRKAPKRMGNSEARLHKRRVCEKKAKLESASKAIKTRIENLEKKEKPKIFKQTKITIPEHLKMHSKNVLTIDHISKSFGERMVFKGSKIIIKNHTKTAIVGKNGTGKTTLLEMIINNEQGLIISPTAKFGYFKQDLKNLNENRTILENVLATSTYKEEYARTILGRLLFRNDDVFKKVSLLSGGERVKVSFAKVFLSDINVLLLDEPTNYLDIKSREALLDVIKSYQGAVIFVSHDREFISQVADDLLIIEDNVIKHFSIKYDEYLEKNNKNDIRTRNKKILKEEIMRLENKLNIIIGKLSMSSKNDTIEQLDKEYNDALLELQKLKNEHNT